MSSKIDIQKRCKWCNAVFTAHKTTTEYCSHRCANLAYKDRVRKQRIESLQHELGKSIKTPPNLNKEYLTPSEVAELLNIGRTSIYRYIRNGVIKVIRFERKTLVRRADIENMTDFIVPETENKQLKEKVKCPQKVGRVKYYPVIERVRYCTGLFPFNRDLILLLL